MVDADGDSVGEGVAWSSPAHWPSSATTGTCKVEVSPLSNGIENVTNWPSENVPWTGMPPFGGEIEQTWGLIGNGWTETCATAVPSPVVD